MKGHDYADAVDGQATLGDYTDAGAARRIVQRVQRRGAAAVDGGGDGGE